MDFIFEEDMDEVGSDIEAYCPKCKGDTAHTVITKYEEEIRRVQCSTCGDVHAFRKPRGEVDDDIPEPAAAKKRAAAKKPSWQEAMDKLSAKAQAAARPYSIRDHYREGDLVAHPKFGTGFVTEASENKAEITFQDERRVLVHNRPDLAAQMPGIAQIPAPREDRKSKKSKKGEKVADKNEKTDKHDKSEKPDKHDKPHDKNDKADKTEKVMVAEVPKGKGSAKPTPAHEPKAEPKPEAKPVVGAAKAGKPGKVDRVKAAVTKKEAAKGKAVATKAKPAAKPAKPAKPARPSRPAARPAKAAKAAAAKPKVKAKKAKAR